MKKAKMDYLQFIERIYDDLYKSIYEDTCYVFLCGGAGKNCIRDKVRKHLEEKQIQVLYPEDLFIEILNRNKNTDLLQYENLLAESADIIFIVCESIGSSAELGAFVQNDIMRNKLLVGINKKYSRDKSFIMDGPVKKIKNNASEKVMIYNVNDLSEFYDNLDRYFKLIKSKIKSKRFTSAKKKSAFSLLPEYISFIPLVIYFFKEINRSELFINAKLFVNKRFGDQKDYNELFNAALNFLHKLGIVAMDSTSAIKGNWHNETLRLSRKGYVWVLELLENSHIPNKLLLHDKLRCDILKEQLYK